MAILWGGIVRIIFLDFDGVLHPAALAVVGPGVTLDELVRRNNLFRWTALLADLLEQHPEVGIVVHSSWRTLSRDFELRELLGTLGPHFMGSAPPGQRWEAIKWVLDDNAVADYRILDDAGEEFPADLPELILCHPERGISDANVRAKLTKWLKNGARR